MGINRETAAGFFAAALRGGGRGGATLVRGGGGGRADGASTTKAAVAGAAAAARGPWRTPRCCQVGFTWTFRIVGRMGIRARRAGTTGRAGRARRANAGAFILAGFFTDHEREGGMAEENGNSTCKKAPHLPTGADTSDAAPRGSGAESAQLLGRGHQSDGARC